MKGVLNKKTETGKHRRKKSSRHREREKMKKHYLN